MAALSDLLVSYKQVEAPTYDSIPELPMDRFTRLQQYISNRDSDKISTNETVSLEELSDSDLMSIIESFMSNETISTILSDTGLDEYLASGSLDA